MDICTIDTKQRRQRRWISSKFNSLRIYLFIVKQISNATKWNTNSERDTNAGPWIEDEYVNRIEHSLHFSFSFMTWDGDVFIRNWKWKEDADFLLLWTFSFFVTCWHGFMSSLWKFVYYIMQIPELNLNMVTAGRLFQIILKISEFPLKFSRNFINLNFFFNRKIFIEKKCT